ncbi:MAG: hypothetical protein CK424_03265 [Legionella sp.]|nr:MAG: hypothetical protein CK424_03265 [Legionella sp.]
MKNKQQEWRVLGTGAFNVAYLNRSGTLVFKSMHNDVFGADTPERSVRLWNQLNPNLKPKAKLATITIGGMKEYGWICPYVQSKHSKRQSTDPNPARDRALFLESIEKNPVIREQEDTDIANALVGIYNRTGRVIVDAAVPGNFVITAQNTAVCIDIGMALLLEEKEDNCLSTYARRASIVSTDAWAHLHEEIHENILKSEVQIFPKTVAMTNALLFIRSYRPDIHNVDFLKENPEYAAQLSKAYEAKESTDHARGIEFLDHKQPMNLSSIKKSCEKNLMNYIQSRGTIDEHNKFHPSFITKIFKNRILTHQKISSAQTLIKKINGAHSMDDIKSILNEAGKDPLSSKGFRSKFAACLGLCKLISHLPPSPELTLTQKASY